MKSLHEAMVSNLAMRKFKLYCIRRCSSTVYVVMGRAQVLMQKSIGIVPPLFFFLFRMNIGSTARDM